MDINILTHDYNIIPAYAHQTKEKNMLNNVRIILLLIILLFIIVYIISYSESYKIKINAT
jgi:hypothetical protein